MLELPLKGDTPVIVHTTDEEAFHISATREYPAGDVTYFLDTAPSGMRAFGDLAWQTYELPHGYSDGPTVSPPILALQMEAGGVLYTIVFHNQRSIGQLQEQILSTFRFLS